MVLLRARCSGRGGPVVANHSPNATRRFLFLTEFRTVASLVARQQNLWPDDHGLANQRGRSDAGKGHGNSFDFRDARLPNRIWSRSRICEGRDSVGRGMRSGVHLDPPIEADDGFPIVELPGLTMEREPVVFERWVYRLSSNPELSSYLILAVGCTVKTVAAASVDI